MDNCKEVQERSGVRILTREDRRGHFLPGDEVLVIGSDFKGARGVVTTTHSRYKSPVEVKIHTAPLLDVRGGLRDDEDRASLVGLSFCYYAMDLKKLSLLELLAEAAT